jgi:hypothetical protein
MDAGAGDASRQADLPQICESAPENPPKYRQNGN